MTRLDEWFGDQHQNPLRTAQVDARLKKPRQAWTHTDHLDQAFHHHNSYIHFINKHREASDDLRQTKVPARERKKQEKTAQGHFALATMHRRSRNREMAHYLSKAPQHELDALDHRKVKSLLDEDERSLMD